MGADDGINFWGINHESFLSVNDQAGRKVIVVELFVIFMVCLYQFLKYPITFENKEGSGDQPSNQAGNEGSSSGDVDVTKEVFFHTVIHFLCAGLSLWEGGAASIIFVILYGICFALLFIGMKQSKDKLIVIGKFGTGLFNFCLIIAGLTAI